MALEAIAELSRVFPGYRFDSDFLTSGVDVADAIDSGDWDHLAQVARGCISIKSGNNDPILIDDVAPWVEKVLKLPDTDYTVVYLEVLVQLVRTLYRLQTGLDHAKFQQKICQWLLLDHTSAIDHQLASLLRLFHPYGALAAIIHDIVKPALVAPDKANVNRLYHVLSGPATPLEFIVFAQPTTFPIAPMPPMRGLAVHMWLRLADSLNPINRLQLFRLSGNGAAELGVYLDDSQIKAEVVTDSDTTLMYPFNQHVDDLGVGAGNWLHVVLTYDDYGNLNLFLQGEYLELMPCPELQLLLQGFTKVVLGLLGAEFVVLTVLILSCSLTSEWVLFLYALGPAFTWLVKEALTDTLMATVNRLNQRQLIELGYKLKLIGQRRDEPFSTVSKQVIISQLARLSGDRVVFDMNDYYRACHDRNAQFRNSSYHFHTVTTVHALLAIVGGPQLLVAILERCLEQHLPELVERALTTLFAVINADWRFRDEFENNHGYGMVLILLTKHRQWVSPTALTEILKHCGYDPDDKQHLLIVNKQCYRFIVLANNFDLWARPNIDSLMEHFDVLLHNKYRAYNQLELRKMKLLKRLAQFLKGYPEAGQGMEKFLVTLLRIDPLVELIRMLLMLVVLGNSAATIVLALAQVLCDKLSLIKTIKKFSRLISIHWLLLLFEDHSNPPQVIIDGIRLLCRLLKLLGPHVIRRFFTLNHGAEVLVHFLRQWWQQPQMLGQLVLAAFGSDSTGADTMTQATKRVDPQTPLLVPEFLVVVSGVVEYSLLTLLVKRGRHLSLPTRQHFAEDRLAITVLDVVEEYTQMLTTGFERVNALRNFFVTKEWLEPAMQIVGYLHTIGTWNTEELIIFRQAQIRLCHALGDIIVRKIQANQFQMTGLDEFIEKTLVELVLPHVFTEVTQFLTKSNFIHNEKQLLAGMLVVVSAYQRHLDQNYRVSDADLLAYLECVVALAEIEGNLLPVKSQLGQLLYNKLCHDSLKVDTLKFMMYRQMVVFQREVLSEQLLGKVVAVILGFWVESAADDALFGNFLRTAYIMNQTQWRQVLSLVFSAEYVDPLVLFFDLLASQNDDDALKWLKRRDVVCRQVVKVALALTSDGDTRVKMSDMIVMNFTNNGASLDSVHINQYVRDCASLRKQIIHNERVRHNRWLQDHKENVAYFVSHYNGVKGDVLRWMGASDNTNATFTLDAIDNANLMRQRFILADQLLELERLSYHVDVPVLREDLPEPLEELFLVLDIEDANESAPLAEADFDEDKNRKVLRLLFMGDQILAIWNISQINGLALIELVMILGTLHLYMIENYYCTRDGNIVDIEDVAAEDRDPIVALLDQPQSSGAREHRTRHWPLTRLANVLKRPFLLRDVALELFSTDGALILITCRLTRDRDAVYGKLSSYASPARLDPDLLVLLSYASVVTNGGGVNVTLRLVLAFSGAALALAQFANITKKWRQGRLSNFYYLMLVNIVAGRTYNDLLQYPVFPWVLADYTLPTLDLSDPKVFRDLSKPMGAQLGGRMRQFVERYHALASLGDSELVPFHYGTHYSLAMIVLLFLIRCQPFVQLYLLLQGGRFDHADRLFLLVERAWQLAAVDNTTDVRELIPEFFYMPEFLVNTNHFDFGTTQLGQSVNDVALPPWAHGDPQVFIAKNREALELPYVLAHLHEWIDLVFGYKQTGDAAVDSVNVFHHTSYLGGTNLDDISDDTQKRAVIGMINNFGQTPVRVFPKPHPPREVLNWPNRYLNLVDHQRLKLVFQSKLKLPIVRLELKKKRRLGGGMLSLWVGRPQCVISDGYLVRKTRQGFLRLLNIDSLTFLDVHDSNITAMASLGVNGFVTGDAGGLLKVWKFSQDNHSLEAKGTLRGHAAAIVQVCYSPSFLLGVSLDADGVVMVWDMIRLKFIRQFKFDDATGKIFVLISHDTGNMGFVYMKELKLVLRMLSINGHELVTHEFPLPAPREVTAINFGRVGNMNEESDRHIYWSSEILGIAMGKELKVYEITTPPSVNEIDLILLPQVEAAITAFELIKASEVDMDERLVRGHLEVVLGDHKGNVYA